MNDTQRNLLIIALVAVAGLVAWPVLVGLGILDYLTRIIFAILLGATLWVMHRNNATRISAMKPQWRYLLQVSGVALYFVVVTGTLLPPTWANQGGIATALFFAMVAACIVGIYTAWQNRAY